MNLLKFLNIFLEICSRSEFKQLLAEFPAQVFFDIKQQQQPECKGVDSNGGHKATLMTAQALNLLIPNLFVFPLSQTRTLLRR